MSDRPTPRTNQAMKYCFGDDREFVTVELAESLEREADALREASERTCAWSYDDEDGYWQSACGVAFYFEVDSHDLSSHHYNFCHKCGGKIPSKGGAR